MINRRHRPRCKSEASTAEALHYKVALGGAGYEPHTQRHPPPSQGAYILEMLVPVDVLLTIDI